MAIGGDPAISKGQEKKIGFDFWRGRITPKAHEVVYPPPYWLGGWPPPIFFKNIYIFFNVFNLKTIN